MKNNDQTLSPLIAIIGCDGSGKSTVSEEILNWVQGYGPAVAAHLGKQSGNIGRALAQLPLISSLLDKFIARKTDSTRAQRKKRPLVYWLRSSSTRFQYVAYVALNG